VAGKSSGNIWSFIGKIIGKPWGKYGKLLYIWRYIAIATFDDRRVDLNMKKYNQHQQTMN
jgi:hypothetical protein